MSAESVAARVFSPAGPLTPPPPGHTWQGLMRMALEEACASGAAGEVLRGRGGGGPRWPRASRCGNAPVRGNDPTAHAEVLALRAAGSALALSAQSVRAGGYAGAPALRAPLLLSMRGWQGLCTARHSLAGAVVSRAEYFDAQCANHRVWHMGGVLAEECAALLHEFFAQRRD